MREEPLGEDHRGRRYWFFYNDAARLWVEAPKGEVIERENGSTWAWAFYDTTAHVEMLINSLDGRVPVRVVRKVATHGDKSFRYDGLYSVSSSKCAPTAHVQHRRPSPSMRQHPSATRASAPSLL